LDTKNINGYWYPAGSSRRKAATLVAADSSYTLIVPGLAAKSGAVSCLKVSQRVADIPRRITFKDQSVFESEDNDAIDAWINDKGGHSGAAWMHRMESRWPWIGIALIAVVIFIYGAARWGLPWVTEFAADHMPGTVIENVSDGSLDIMDKVFFKPSTLSKDRKTALKKQFNSVLDAAEASKYTLHFRSLGAPNAMALPAGDLVVTDKFAEMASAEEFNAVMFHEIGHVVERHGIQQLVRSSIVSFMIALFIGDPTGLEELMVGFPVFLMQSHYSRSDESEADEYAFQSMLERGMDPIHFATIMEKMARFDVADDDLGLKDGGPDQEKTVLDYLSSHPATVDRIKRAKDLSSDFRQ